MEYMYHLQDDVIDSAAKHAMVIFYVKLIHCDLMYFAIVKYSIKEFLSIAK